MHYENTNLEEISKKVKNITDTQIKEIILTLFNIIERQAQTITNLQQENQKVKDENNRLKGEQGKPEIKANVTTKDKNISSEKEREKNNNRKKKKKHKKKNRKISYERQCKVNKDELPEDVEYKGTISHIVQDINFEVENIEFKREKYYSKSTSQTYLGQLPAGYEGDYGPGVKTLCLVLKNDCNVSEPNILKLLNTIGIDISAGTISRILIKNKEDFHQEKKDIVRSGLETSDYQQTDHSYTRVNGANWYTQILCNPLYTAFFTVEHKTRLSVLEILLTGEGKNGEGLKYQLNEETILILKNLGVNKKIRSQIKEILSEKIFTKKEIEEYLMTYISGLKSKNKNKIITACAISYYHSQEYYPIIKTLVCDDAPEFKLITEKVSLCWIHEGRHYKKLSPIIKYNIDSLNNFIEKYWLYYKKLLFYKAKPSPELAEKLSLEFDILFTTYTGYESLDERIAKTLEKKDRLLLVLKYPHLPLHNNASELGARAVVRKRDVSLQTITEEGTKANDTFLTITNTCRKLGVNCFDYIYDRITKCFKMKSLALLIKEKSASATNYCLS